MPSCLWKKLKCVCCIRFVTVLSTESTWQPWRRSWLKLSFCSFCSTLFRIVTNVLWTDMTSFRSHYNSIFSLPSSRQHLSNDNCLYRKTIRTVLCCIVYTTLCTVIRTHEQFLKLTVGLASGFLLIFVCFCVPVLFAFVVLGLISSVLGQ